MFKKVMEVLTDQLPLDIDLAQSYANGQNEEQQLISNLAQFLSSYLRKHANLCEVFDPRSDESRAATRAAHELALKYILKISEVNDTEVFKVRWARADRSATLAACRFASIIGIG